jgi:hypothetical protein
MSGGKRIVWIALLLFACERDSSAEARMFLDRLDALDLDDPVADRRRLLTSLENMPIADPEIAAARAVCADAHRTTLEAEELTERVRSALAEYPDERDIPPARRMRIETDLATSNRNIRRARPLFDRCNRERHQLDREYRRRH